MRKIIVSIHSTFNGVVTGDPAGDKTDFLVWTTPQSLDTGSESLLEAMAKVDTILFGHNTYADLARKWPFVADWPDVKPLHLRLGEKVNRTRKLVVTGEHSHEELKWGEFAAPEPVRGSNVTEQIRKLKQGAGGDIMTFGSPTLVRSLADADLVDEYQIQVHPVVVNVGEHLFDGIAARRDFDLVGVEPLADGSMLVTYKPAKGS